MQQNKNIGGLYTKMGKLIGAMIPSTPAYKKFRYVTALIIRELQRKCIFFHFFCETILDPKYSSTFAASKMKRDAQARETIETRESSACKFGRGRQMWRKRAQANRQTKRD